MDLSVIIVSFNTKKLLADCIRSLRKHTKSLEYEIIVVDNNSQDGSVELAESFTGSIRVIKNKKNLGFSKANNQGMKVAKGRYVLLLNSDTFLTEDTISTMVHWMEKNPTVGVASCRLKSLDGSLQANGGYLPNLPRLFFWAAFLDDLPLVPTLFGAYHLHALTLLGPASIYNKSHAQDWVSGALFLIRREVFESIGYLDEDFFMYAEDVDYCLRAKKAGWKIWFVSETGIMHIGSASSAGEQVRFLNTQVGKERSVLGEFEGLKILYKKHCPNWQFFLARLILKLAAILRFVVFGLLLGQDQARRVYAKALAIS